MTETINKFNQKLAEFTVKFKIPIIIIVLILTIFFGYYTAKIQIDADLLNSLPKDDPVVNIYNKIGDKYGGNTSAMVILETDNVFKPEVLEHIKQITDTLEVLNGISYVTSLTNIIDIRSDSGQIVISKLVDEYNLPKTKSALDSLKERVFSKDMYRGVVVSEDSTATMIVATLTNDANKQEVAKQIKQKVLQMNLPEKIYFSGIPFLLNDSNDIILNDLKKLIPLTILLIIIVLFLGFRSWRGVLLPLLIVGISVVWTIGLIAFLGYKLSVISDVIPVILIALGSAYAIHVLNRINEIKAENPTKALIIGLAAIITPVFLAYITTAFGFTSFIFGAYLVTIKQFGIFTAIGITFAFLLSIFFMPAIIDLFHFSRKTEYKAEESKLVKRILTPISEYVMEKPKFILAIWLALAILIGIGYFKVHRKVDMVSYFKKGSAPRVAQELIDKKFGGVSPIFVIFKGDVQSPEFLKLMKQTEDFMKQNPYVSYTLSVADLIEQMNDAMGEGMKIPDDRFKIEQLWFLIEGEDIMNQLVSYDLDEAIIQARFASLDTKEANKFVEIMDKYIKENSTNEIQISITGMPHVYQQIDKSLVKSQIMSLILATILMFLVVSITMWSARCGILSIIPLLITIIFSFGFMGYLNIPLDTVTVLIASVTLGVGIDYAVHIIAHYREFMKEGKIEEAIEKAIRISGNAILINVLAVSGGFLILLFSNLAPLRNFGLMMAITMIISGFAAITLLPSILFLINKNKTK